MLSMQSYDSFADLSLDQLKNIELRFLERRSNAKKLKKLAAQHRRTAYSLDQSWKREIEEINRDLPHIQAMIVAREAVEPNLIPFPSVASKLRQTDTRSKKRRVRFE